MEKGVRTRLYRMLNDGIMTDVTFVVQGTEIKAHRHIICSYEGHLRDLLETKNEKIEINDISPQTLRTVLQYLYTDKCDVDPKNIFELLYAAKKFNLDELLTKCREFFKSNTWEIIHSKEFLEIPKEVLLEFCSTEDISCSALDLCAACLRWAQKECIRQDLKKTSENLVTVVGDALHKIRLSEISIPDFLQFIVPLNVLSHEEVGQIIAKKHEQFKGEICSLTWWPTSVRVIVRDYWKDRNDDTELYLPRTTRISELKKMRIFQGGKVGYPADEFTLWYISDEDDDDDRELNGDMALADLGSVHQIQFEIHSIEITVKIKDEEYDYPMTIETQDLWIRDLNLIKGYVFGLQKIHTDHIRYIRFRKKIPGGTATVSVV